MITVEQLCQLQIFKDGFRLIAGHEGLAKGVQHVTVAEVPDFTDFDLGKELFVLTTFFAFHNDSDRIAEAAIKLCRKNISALAIKVDRFIDTVPPAVIKIANENQLPLFLVSKNIAFREIIGEISTEIINSQLNTIKTLNDQHEVLMSSILKGDKIEEFIHTLGESLQRYCACVSFSKTILAKYAPEGLAEEPDSDVIHAIDQLMDLADNAGICTRIDEYDIFPCYVYNQTMGYLVIRSADLLNDRQSLLIKQMVSFLSIKFLEQYLKIETEQRLIMAIVDQVLFQRHTDETVLQDRLKLLGLVSQKNHFILMLSFRNEEPNGTMQFAIHSWNATMNGFFPNSAIFLKGTELVTIVSVGEKSPYSKESGIRKALLTMLEASPPKEESQVDIGCSLIVNDLRLLPDCYGQARRAIQFGRAFKPESKVFFCSQFIEQGLISHGLASYEHKWIINKIILPIKEYDEKYAAELWLTLERCLLAKSLENAAADLHIHSSTLRYRLQRIHAITGIDFFSQQGGFLLKMAYFLAKIETP